MSDSPHVQRTPSVVGRAFLLRVWLTTSEESLRASVSDVDTGERRVFVDIDDLADWLGRCLD